MTETTQPGVSEKEEPLTGVQPDLKRFNEIEEMADRHIQQRVDDIKDRMESDPDFKLSEDAYNKEVTAHNEGLATIETIEEEDPDKVPETVVENPTEIVEDPEEPVDPLADYIVMQDDAPMFRAKVDGKEVLIPLEKARAQLQKGTAAEVRLQQAVEIGKQLNIRTETLQKNERAYQQKGDLMNTPPSEPAPDVDDETLNTEVKEVISTLFSGSADDAAEKLATVLRRNRAPATPAPVVNTEALVRRTAQAVTQQIEEGQKARASKRGYEEFSKEYPDIVADTNLFKVADGMTDEIVAEHPEWEPPQVMLEAGKRTRQWRDGEKSPAVDVAADTADRQSRKARLVPMPRPADAKPAKEPEEPPYTPQEAVDEMRKSRGQHR